MERGDLLACLTLAHLRGLTTERIRQLVGHFGGPCEALAAGPARWIELIPGISRAALPAALELASAGAIRDAELVRQHGARVCFSFQGPYPPLLGACRNPPPVLYAIGHDITVEHEALAMVGSRRATYYGLSMAKRFAGELAPLGVLIVSGLAHGIDTAAHAAAMESGGETWAVLGSGLAHIYPRSNVELSRRIANQGAVISEFPMDTKPHPALFPQRNRVIAGLSQATVLMEGDERSGALITARWAADEGREVFAVPGPATSRLSRAPHTLLRQGAAFAETALDLLAAFPKAASRFAPSPATAASSLPPDQAALHALLCVEPQTRDMLQAKTGLSTAAFSSALTGLEIMGLARTVAGGRVMASQ